MLATKIFLGICLILAVVSLSSASVRLDLANGTVIRLESAQLFYEGLPDRFDTYSGEMVSENENDTSIFNGRIVYWRTGTPPEKKIRKFMAYGVIGIVMGSGWITPGRHMYLSDHSGTSDFTIPISQLRKPDWPLVENAFKSQRIINVTVTSEEGNTWYNINESGAMIAGQVLISAMALAAMGLAIYKLHIYKTVQGLRWNVSQVTLWLELIANALRFIYTAVDPINVRTYYGYWGNNFLERLSMPFGLGASLLIIFFWHEAMKRAIGGMHPFLHKLKIPFFVLIAALLGFHFAVYSVAVTQWTSFPMDLLIRGIHVGITGLILIFYIYTGIRVLLRLKKQQKMSGRYQALLKTSKLMLVSASGLALYCILEIVYLPEPFPTAQFYTVFFFLYYFAMIVTSIAQILAFQAKSLKGTSSTSASGNTDKNSITNNNSSTASSQV